MSAAFGKSKEVSCEQTNQRMFDDSLPSIRPEKGMTASAGVFGEPLPGGDGVDAVAEEIAEISDLLFEQRLAGIRVFADFEQQWMATLPAHVFVVPVPLRNPRVHMPEDKTRHCMRNTRLTLIEIIDSAHTVARCATHFEECKVVYTVSKQSTCQIRHDVSSLQTKSIVSNLDVVVVGLSG
jgi:hypothetical protein